MPTSCEQQRKALPPFTLQAAPQAMRKSYFLLVITCSITYIITIFCTLHNHNATTLLTR